jgi:hypothetical protein
MEMEIYSVDEFLERWDEMIERVEHGERLGITNGTDQVVMCPADDELLALYSNHNEAP